MSAPPRSTDTPIELVGIGHDLPRPELDLGLSLATTKAHGLVAYWRARPSTRSGAGAPDREEEAEANVNGALAFAEAIATLHRHGDLLPARVGTGFTSAKSLRHHLDKEHTTYLEALARIRGCTEIALRIDLKPSDEHLDADTGTASSGASGGSTGAGRGRAYLLARRAEDRRREALKGSAAKLAAELQEALHGIIREQRAELVSERRGHEAVAVALLVERARLASLRSALSEWLERGDHRGIANGPLAPYSFVATAKDDSPTR